MKALISIIFFIWTVISATYAVNSPLIHCGLPDTDTMHDSLEGLTSEVRSDPASSEKYSRLAYAYCNRNMIPEAIWAYSKALLLNPANSDAANNLQVLNQRVLSDQETVPDSFFVDNWKNISAWWHPYWWFLLSAIFLVTTPALLLWFMLSSSPGLRKILFIIIMVFASGSLLATSQYVSIVIRAKSGADGIVIKSNIALFANPEVGSQQMQIIRPGSRVKRIKEQDQWIFIQTPAGHQGFVRRSDVSWLDSPLPR